MRTTLNEAAPLITKIRDNARKLRTRTANAARRGRKEWNKTHPAPTPPQAIPNTLAR